MQTLSVRETNQLKIDRGYLTTVGLNRSKVYEVKSYATIGRDPSCQVVFNDPFMSLRHARIEAKSDGFYIRDLNSRNGTLLNGMKILEARLSSNDRLRIGNTEFVFTLDKLSDLSPAYTTSLNSIWSEQLQRVPAIAQSSHSVLLLGPSGSGKEVMASLIHKLSHRSNGPLISVNCSALTESLAESELFGHVKGSFSGALTDRKGAFEAARGGTLFLDEIGDLPAGLQPKLLRALENQEIRPVGSDLTVKVDARIIAATNRDLRELTRANKFREDLYFRLHILQLSMPALKDRMEDFDNLLRHFADPLGVRFTLPGLIRLREYSWPGNIRELKNVVMRASAMFPDQPIGDQEVEVLLDRPVTIDERAPTPTSTPAANLIRQFEKDLIIERLIANRGNQRRTAKDLGMPKSTLHDRVRSFGIDLDAIRGKKD